MQGTYSEAEICRPNHVDGLVVVADGSVGNTIAGWSVVRAWASGPQVLEDTDTVTGDGI